MGFISGMIAGVAAATAAAAWYMSRAGSAFRDKYRVDRKLGELGDEIDVRTRDVRTKVASQVDDVRSNVTAQVDEARSNMTGGNGTEAVTESLDDVQAEAAEIAADVEAKASKAKRAVKSDEPD
jgi:gas vesicle protein